jgi:hypothetical protein
MSDPEHAIEQNPPETSQDENLATFEAAFIHEYLNNGHHASKAYLALRPNVTPGTANVSSTRLLQRPHVKAYLAKRLDKSLEEVKLNKTTLLNHAQWGLNKARETYELSALFKGIDISAKLINAYDQDEDDLSKYTGLIGRIKADNVNIQVNINKNE